MIAKRREESIGLNLLVQRYTEFMLEFIQGTQVELIYFLVYLLFIMSLCWLVVYVGSWAKRSE